VDAPAIAENPACLWRENSHRLVSVWDLLKRIATHELFYYFNKLTSVECIAIRLRMAGAGGHPVDAELLKHCVSVVEDYELLGQDEDLAFLRAECRRAKDHLSRDVVDVSSAQTVLNNLKGVFVDGLKNRYFLLVSDDRTGFVEQTALFGPEVARAFPSAASDIRESGNCLAAECTTAAVFHLMRAVEYGLRALAEDRGIKLAKDLPINLATWEDLIKRLEEEESAIQGFPKTLAREEQFAFYHGAMMELKRFKNKFRNTVMHTREEYDRHEAYSAFDHVKAFMEILASKIAEGVTTPRIWV
jgi:hypothetical protein